MKNLWWNPEVGMCNVTYSTLKYSHTKIMQTHSAPPTISIFQCGGGGGGGGTKRALFCSQKFPRKKQVFLYLTVPTGTFSSIPQEEKLYSLVSVCKQLFQSKTCLSWWCVQNCEKVVGQNLKRSMLHYKMILLSSSQRLGCSPHSLRFSSSFLPMRELQICVHSNRC